jgi:hypothetical protein
MIRKTVSCLLLSVLCACNPLSGQMISTGTPTVQITDMVQTAGPEIQPVAMETNPAVQVTYEGDLAAIKQYLSRADLEGEALGRTESLNFPGLEVDRYRIDGIEFELDAETRQIVWIDTANSVLPKNSTTILSVEELMLMAGDLTQKLAPDAILTDDTLTVSQKGQNTFFRWQIGSGKFIQVGYDEYGNLLNFIVGMVP